MHDMPPASPAKPGAGASIRDLATQMAAEPLGWLRGEIDRLFDDYSKPGRGLFNLGAPILARLPALEMSEEDKQYRLTAELPGLSEDDVDISVADGMLTIAGEKKEKQERKDKGYIFSERRYGSFQRQITLPSDVDPAKINASFKNGMLTLLLAKDAKATPRRRKIEIEKS